MGRMGTMGGMEGMQTMETMGTMGTMGTMMPSTRGLKVHQREGNRRAMGMKMLSTPPVSGTQINPHTTDPQGRTPPARPPPSPATEPTDTERGRKAWRPTARQPSPADGGPAFGWQPSPCCQQRPRESRTGGRAAATWRRLPDQHCADTGNGDVAAACDSPRCSRMSAPASPRCRVRKTRDLRDSRTRLQNLSCLRPPRRRAASVAAALCAATLAIPADGIAGHRHRAHRRLPTHGNAGRRHRADHRLLPCGCPLRLHATAVAVNAAIPANGISSRRHRTHRPLRICGRPQRPHSTTVATTAAPAAQ